MKPYIEYLAEETGIKNDVQTALRVGLIKQKQIEAAADKFAEAKIEAFEKWKNENFVTSEKGNLDYIKRFESKLRLGKTRFKLSELIAIFNSETTV